jgi:hypothetical protein
MTLLQGWGAEIAEQLESGQVAICAKCDEFWFDRRDLWEIEGPPICERCGLAGAFRPGYLGRNKKDRQLTERWDPDVLKRGWTATPDLLADHLGELGLNERHYFLLRTLESYRRRGGGDVPVCPSIDMLTDRTRWSRRKVQRTLSELRERGYIEIEQRIGRHGRPAENAITRNGLDAALKRIAGADVRADHDVRQNVETRLEGRQF